VLEDATRMVEESTGTKVDLTALPLDDEPTYKLFQSAHTIGIFQLESSGMRDLLRKVTPDTFEDIIAINALFRPGPIQSGMIDDFVKRKHGRAKVVYPHPTLEAILKPTYGVIVYQDQVMQVANRLAGFSLAQADLLRRAMGKKMPEEMARMKSAFIEGAAKNNCTEKKAGEIFDLMEKFAGYGFVRAHSTAYAALSYQAAWLKTHHPAAYVAASLTSEVGNTDRIVTLVDEARRLGITVHPPDVNASRAQFALEGDGIRFGLAAVKNVGQGSVEAIVRAREEGGPFQSLGDLIRRVDLSAINRRVLESLIQAGACDRLGGDRAQLLEAVGDLLSRAQGQARGVDLAQESLFGAGEVAVMQDPPLPNTPPWPLEERLRREKDVLGFYFSDHPLAAYRPLLAMLEARGGSTTLGLRERKEGDEVPLLGIVASVKTHMDRNKRPMAFVTIEDLEGTVEATCFNDLWERSRAVIVPGAVLEIKGRVNLRDEADPKMVLLAARAVAVPDPSKARSLYLEIDESSSGQPLDAVRALLVRHPGESPVYFTVRGADGSRAVIRAKTLLANPCEELLQALRTRLGADAVRLADPDPEAVAVAV
ncbi:MAG TPA: DNA polymerase III subunit alpha, partial [Candidatus Eisenbacteria bacterium]